VPHPDQPPLAARPSVQTTMEAEPVVSTDGVHWRIPRTFAPDGIRLEVDWVLGQDPEFSAVEDHWAYWLPRPAAHRLEYRLTLRGGRGGDHPALDPTNPRTVPNPFGNRSEIRFPEYREPQWLGTPVGGSLEVTTGDRGPLDAPVPVRLWSPAGLAADVPAPLVIAHDGTALREDASLLSWASQRAAVGGPLRIALLDPAPGFRDRWYAANPAYSDHLVSNLLPSLRDRVSTSAVVGLGISLGALSLLALHRRHPSALDGMALQSGSFFTPLLDPQESRYAFFDQVCLAVAEISAAPGTVPTWMSCGAIEENLANNDRMASALKDQGYPLVFQVVPDAHTMIGWRDAWTPGLDRLLSQVS
jgi:enterochelin esterase-like enzyme